MDYARRGYLEYIKKFPEYLICEECIDDASAIIMHIVDKCDKGELIHIGLETYEEEVFSIMHSISALDGGEKLFWTEGGRSSWYKSEYYFIWIKC